MFAIKQNKHHNNGDFDNARHDPRTGDIATFFNLLFFKLINQQKQLNRQNNRNQGRTDKIDNAWGDKFEFIVFYNIVNDATNSTNNYGVD